MELTIYKKLLDITKEAEQIPKNGYNDFSNYHYVRAVDALGAIKKLLVSHGVHLTIKETGLRRYRDGKNFHSEIEAVARFIDVDNPESYHETTYFSVSADTLDKDIFKAKTNGLKYLFTQEFKLVTDDFIDTEQGHKGEKDIPEAITKDQTLEIESLKEKLNPTGDIDYEIKFKNALQAQFKKPEVDRLDTEQAKALIAKLKARVEYVKSAEKKTANSH